MLSHNITYITCRLHPATRAEVTGPYQVQRGHPSTRERSKRGFPRLGLDAIQALGSGRLWVAPHRECRNSPAGQL